MVRRKDISQIKEQNSNLQLNNILKHKKEVAGVLPLTQHVRN